MTENVSRFFERYEAEPELKQRVDLEDETIDELYRVLAEEFED